MDSEIIWNNFSKSVHPFLSLKGPYSQMILIVDSQVAKLYSSLLSLIEKELPSQLIVIEAGEQTKTRKTKEWIEDELFRFKAHKNTLLVALGGGVVSDITGFVASTYFRGIAWVCIPTTLTGMIDASIGGKTGINTSYGKNTIGAFYPPHKIAIDPDFLKTLPEKERENGFAESIKYGCLADLRLLDSKKVYKKDPQNFLESCIQIKRHFIERDPYDKSIRRHLNLGHTIGHALENAWDYRHTHGQCVAIGLILESQLNLLQGHLPLSDYKKISLSVEQHFSSLPWADLPDPPFLYSLCQRDKKNDSKDPLITLLSDIGKVVSQKKQFTTFTQNTLEQAYEELLHGHHNYTLKN